MLAFVAQYVTYTEYVYKLHCLQLSNCAILIFTDSKLGGHNSASSKSKIKPACDALHNKPFKGRIFYLDLPWNMKTQLLENDIRTLGGVSSVYCLIIF